MGFEDNPADNENYERDLMLHEIKTLQDEVEKLTKQLDRINSHPLKFGIDKAEYAKFKEWKDKKDLEKYTGAIGGRFTYEFTPTSLGIVIKVRDSMDKDEIDLTDYNMW